MSDLDKFNTNRPTVRTLTGKQRTKQQGQQMVKARAELKATATHKLTESLTVKAQGKLHLFQRVTEWKNFLKAVT